MPIFRSGKQSDLTKGFRRCYNTPVTRTTQAVLLFLPLLLLLTAPIAEYAEPGILSHAVGAISPGCLFRRLTGIACPGCGGTRAARALLDGDIRGACLYNFFLLPSLLLLAAEYGRHLIVFIRKRSFPTSKTYIGIVRIYAYLAVFWFILRNILHL